MPLSTAREASATSRAISLRIDPMNVACCAGSCSIMYSTMLSVMYEWSARSTPSSSCGLGFRVQGLGLKASNMSGDSDDPLEAWKTHPYRVQLSGVKVL